MRSLERVNIGTNERTYVRMYVLTYIRTGQTLYPLHNFVVRGDNKFLIGGCSRGGVGGLSQRIVFPKNQNFNISKISEM